MVFDIRYRAEFVETSELASVGEELVKLAMRQSEKTPTPRELRDETARDMMRARDTVAMAYGSAMEHLSAFRESSHDKMRHSFAECVYLNAAMAWQDSRRLIRMMESDDYCSFNNRQLAESIIDDMDKATIAIIEKTWLQVKDKFGKNEKYRTTRTYPPYVV